MTTYVAIKKTTGEVYIVKAVPIGNNRNPIESACRLLALFVDKKYDAFNNDFYLDEQYDFYLIPAEVVGYAEKLEKV